MGIIILPSRKIQLPRSLRKQRGNWNINFKASLNQAQASNFVFNSGWSANGTMDDGGSAVLTYIPGGLPVRADERPLWFRDFNSDFAPHTLSRSPVSRTPWGGSTPCIIQSAVKPSNDYAGCARQNMVGNGNSFGPNIFQEEPLIYIPATGAVYMSVKRRIDFNFSTQNVKMFRGWPHNAIGSTPDIYISNAFVQAMNVEGINSTITDRRTFYDPFPQMQNTFINCEYTFQASTNNVMDGWINHCANGNWAFPTDQRFFTRKSGTDPGTNVIQEDWFSDQISNPSMPDNSGMYYSDMYWTDTHFRLVVSQEPVYLTAAQGNVDPGIYREPQLLASSGNNANQLNVAQFRKGRHAKLKGSGLYLYAVTSIASALQVGYWPVAA